jgi:hypothetical protein
MLWSSRRAVADGPRWAKAGRSGLAAGPARWVGPLGLAQKERDKICFSEIFFSAKIN